MSESTLSVHEERRSPLLRYLTGISGAVLWFSAAYLPVAIAAAAHRHLWNDELFTFYIARLGSFDKIYAALLAGADQNPPLFYWLSSLGMKLHAATLGIRLPAIFGVWIMGVGLIVWFSRYGMAAYGLVAALFAIVSGAGYYATEARPYGLVVGLAATAIVCWQRTLIGRNITLWTTGLAASLGLSLCFHYYAVLLFPPIAIAELAVAWTERRIRWTVWLGLLVAMLPLVLWLPLIQAARSYSGTFWAQAGPSSIADFYAFVLFPALLPLLGFIAAIWLRYILRPATARLTVFPTLPESVCILSLSATPVLAIVLGRFVTGAYTHRYAVFAITGIAIAVAWLLMLLLGSRTRPALMAAVILTIFFFAREVRRLSSMADDYDHAADAEFLTEHVPTGEIAIADPHLFFELSHQAPPSLRTRLFYIADRPAALRHLDTDAVDRSVMDIKSLAGLRVRGLPEVLASGEPFGVYGYPGNWVWLVEELADRRIPISITSSYGKRLLLVAGASGTATEKRR